MDCENRPVLAADISDRPLSALLENTTASLDGIAAIIAELCDALDLPRQIRNKLYVIYDGLLVNTARLDEAIDRIDNLNPP